MPAFLIPGETITLNQDGSLSVQQRYSLAQTEVGNFNPSRPQTPQGNYELESVSVANLEAGLAEGTATWKLPNTQTLSGSTNNLRNVTVEIVASTREEPLSLFKGTGNFDFASLTAQEVKDARDAADGLNTSGDTVGSQAAVDALPTALQKNLARYYQKGIEYFLSPSITVRVSGRTNTVNTSNVGKAYAAGNLPAPADMRPVIPNPGGSNYEWLLTSITSRSVPPADVRSQMYFEVTEEYLLSPRAGWDENLYPSGTGTIIDNA
jgi:hypothetical protein